MASALLLYEPLDVIGNGSFGIIRKVRRKSDGVIFARKELRFERMSERDRKQIVAEVNILKDLHHEHIVRYHDRHVDRNDGILYIIMEYCGGGDLSTVLKQAQRLGRPIPEETIWNYFMQILLALNYCHHPNGHGRTSSAGNGVGGEGSGRRPQILHRDLKPDNVFLGENNTVKLGDFGLSKALPQATFANTYVGTPYYMSPELMQEKAYDSKSDIWSLGCVIYELCALKPPFAEAKTHSELSILIRNGRIPPLPKGYSPALTGVIKSMLNLNPAMRPSAAQLLQHERLELAFKINETQKMLNAVKAHKSNVVARERELAAREAAVSERESKLAEATAQRESEIQSLRTLLSAAESKIQSAVRDAVLAREEELRSLVARKEADLAATLALREQEIMAAVNRREQESTKMWANWAADVRQEAMQAISERIGWVQQRAEEMEREQERLDSLKEELERRSQQLQNSERRSEGGVTKAKTPLEDLKNILAPLARLTESPDQETPGRPSKPSDIYSFKTPNPRIGRAPPFEPFSAMKGVVLTTTGEALPTPSPAEIAKLFVATPKVSLNFTKIFDFDSDAEDSAQEDDATDRGYDTDSRPSSSKSDEYKSDLEATPTQATSGSASTIGRQTRLRRPSIRGTSRRPSLDRLPKAPFASTSAMSSTSSTSSKKSRQPSPCLQKPSPSLQKPSPASAPKQPPEYDLSDEENLPSPFLKRIDRERLTRTTSVSAIAKTGGVSSLRNVPRKSGGSLRTLAVVNAARGVAGKTAAKPRTSSSASSRSSIGKAQKASEDARKALVRS